MSTLAFPAFDTLRYVKRLKEADVPEKQAEAQAEALREVLADQAAAQGEANASVVTQADTKVERASVALEKKIDAGFAKIEADFAEMRGDINLLKWMLGTLIGLASAALLGVAALLLKVYF